MRRLIVNMDIRPLDIRQALELHLQLLRHVVRLHERRVGVHDDIHLGDEPRARVVRTHRIDLEDGRRVREAHIRDELLDLHARRHTHEEQELGKGRPQPDGRDDDAQEDGTCRVEPPHQLGTADGRQETEAVDEQVVAVVLPENADLAVPVLDGPRVQKQRELCGERDAHGDDRGEVEGLEVAVRFRQVLGAESNDDERHGRHDEAEGNVSDRLETGLSRGEPAGVHALDGAVGQDERYVAQGVEDGVGHGGEEREGAGRNGGVELEGCQQDVGYQRPPHGDLELEVVLALLLLGLGAVLLDALEHALNRLVLRLVEPLHPSRVVGPTSYVLGHLAARRVRR